MSRHMASQSRKLNRPRMIQAMAYPQSVRFWNKLDVLLLVITFSFFVVNTIWMEFSTRRVADLRFDADMSGNR